MKLLFKASQILDIVCRLMVLQTKNDEKEKSHTKQKTTNQK